MNKSEGSSTAVSQVTTTLERMTDLTPPSDEANYVLSYKGSAQGHRYHRHRSADRPVDWEASR